MGETLVVKAGDVVTIEMRMDVPSTSNSPYSFPNPLLKQVGVNQPINRPTLDHVDLIRGTITGLVSPNSPNYAVPNTAATIYNPSTQIFATANSSNWTVRQLGDSAYRVTYRTKIVAGNTPFYIRARGTNMPPAVPNVTDSGGNPLPDTGIINVVCSDPACPAHLPTVDGTRRVKNDVEAWSNLWFYANPIYVRPRRAEKLQVEVAAELAASLGGQRAELEDGMKAGKED